MILGLKFRSSKVGVETRLELCEEGCRHIMDAWGERSDNQPRVFQKLKQVVELKRTSSDTAVQDLNKISHVRIPYGKAPYRSRKARKILKQNETTRPVPRGTWIPGVNDDAIKKPTHYMPSETPPSTMRQHQRRVLSANTSSKSLCSSFNSKFLLPGNSSSSDTSGSDAPLLIRDDSDLSLKHHQKATNIRKTKSMYEGPCTRVIKVAECKTPRFSTLPRKPPQVNRNESLRLLNRVPVFDAEELDNRLSTDSGLPGMCDITPPPTPRLKSSCTCCSICEMVSPRDYSCSIGKLKNSNCSCSTCLYSKDKPGLVQYKHGDVIKTFDWLNQYAKETAL